MFIWCKKKNELDYYRGIDYIKMFCKKLKDHALKITNYEKNEMRPLSEEENKSYEKQEVCHIWKKKFFLDENDENEKYENDENENDKKFKKCGKVKDHFHYTGKFRVAAHSECNLKYQLPKNIPIVIQNAGYDTRFIINQ